MKLTERSITELSEMRERYLKEYSCYKSKGIKLSMTRGVPCPEQLNLSMDMLKITDYIDDKGVDCRNYGGVDGISECKALFAELLGVRDTQIIIGGNSSLNMMHDTISRAMLLGVPGYNKPWVKENKVKFICPTPGYDRHFSICELYNIEMISVPILESAGPDIEVVKRLVAEDPEIKGMWLVPKYSNPLGVNCADYVIKVLAKMQTAAPDFRIMCDNAYAFHHLTDAETEVRNLINECEEAGNPDRAIMFASTSKITFAGAGVAVMATSENAVNQFKKQIGAATIGPDKLNQLRHVKFFKNADGLRLHMKKHARILKPKFDLVCDGLRENLSGTGIASWYNPEGGYFINLQTLPGCAEKIVRLAAEAGVELTSPAGSAFPYKMDPEDQNIRIAPSFPDLEKLKIAVKILSLCVIIISIEKILAEK